MVITSAITLILALYCVWLSLRLADLEGQVRAHRTYIVEIGSATTVLQHKTRGIAPPSDEEEEP